MADGFALWVATLDDEDIPDDEASLQLFARWIAADLAEQIRDRGLDPADVAQCIGESEVREACEAVSSASLNENSGFARVALRGDGGVSERLAPLPIASFGVRIDDPKGSHVRVRVWVNGAYAGTLTMLPHEGEALALALGAEQSEDADFPPCTRCGKPIKVKDAAEVGADGYKLYHPACWQIVSREGEG